MAHCNARVGKWRGNWRLEWVASTLHTISEHGVSSITTPDTHTSAASSRLNWHPPGRFKWTRPFRRKTKSGFCACAITFQTQSKGKVHPRRGHEGPKVETNSSTLSSSSALGGCGWSTPRSDRFTPQLITGTSCIGGWVGPTEGLDGWWCKEDIKVTYPCMLWRHVGWWRSCSIYLYNRRWMLATC